MASQKGADSDLCGGLASNERAIFRLSTIHAGLQGMGLQEMGALLNVVGEIRL
jgi:hypothetical protein